MHYNAYRFQSINILTICTKRLKVVMNFFITENYKHIHLFLAVFYVN